ncbi:hypothetical protein EON80_09630, partial [bacterium]
MSQNSNSPFESSTSDSPTTAPRPSLTKAAPTPQVHDLYQANKEASAQVLQDQRLMPALGMTPLPKYRPSGRIGALGIPLLLFTLLLVPLWAAFLYDKLWHFRNMAFFSAIALGVLVGFATYPAIHFGKVRNRAVAGILGAIIGFATFTGAMGLEA